MRLGGKFVVESSQSSILIQVKGNRCNVLVDSQTQTDPSFKSTRLYTRLSAAEVRYQLIEKKGYTDDQLPTVETILLKLNQLGYGLKRVAKILPQKKYPKPKLSLQK